MYTFSGIFRNICNYEHNMRESVEEVALGLNENFRFYIFTISCEIFKKNAKPSRNIRRNFHAKRQMLTFAFTIFTKKSLIVTNKFHSCEKVAGQEISSHLRGRCATLTFVANSNYFCDFRENLICAKM
jgi:hypothetical protein